MTTRRIWSRGPAGLRAGLVLGLGAVLLLGGCKKPPPPPPPPPPRKVAPPPPEPIDVASLVQSMNVDARVEFAEAAAPVDRGLAEAAIHLADAFARGDDGALRGMLDKGDQRILDRLLASEQWWEETEKLEAVRVTYVSASGVESPEVSQVGIALQDPEGAYLLTWDARKVFDDWVFAAVGSGGEERHRASEWDGVVEAGVAGASMSWAGTDSDPELMGLVRRAMVDPSKLTMEELLKLKELLTAAGDAAPEGALEMVDEEIAKRQDRGGGEGEGGGGGPGGRRDQGPGAG